MQFLKHCEEWMEANKKDSKGVTQQQHFETLKKMGAPVPKISLTSVPKDLDYLKTYWLQCRRGQIITYQDLFYFQQMMYIDLQPWECSIIMQIDNIYWSSENASNRDANSQGGIGRNRVRNR